VTGVEFVSLATAGQGELVTAFSWELTAYRKQIRIRKMCVRLRDRIRFPHPLALTIAKSGAVGTRDSNPSVVRCIRGRWGSVASEGVGRARGMCWRHLDREGHGRSPFLRWTSLGLNMAHERTIHTPWNAPGAAPRVQSRQETLHTRAASRV